MIVAFVSVVMKVGFTSTYKAMELFASFGKFTDLYQFLCSIYRMGVALKPAFVVMNKFIRELNAAKLDGAIAQKLRHLEKIHVIVFDDFGLQKLDPDIRLTIMDILENRYKKGATIALGLLVLQDKQVKSKPV
ncbi:hypothetical protein A4D02_27865 [Niastella koreensis]|uniref:IstB-like ATP-binding domain-containing protein n=2 Tax=Niastella koreensis TaxID=354356 RepID=G8TI45_NIAKG|nr:ATP-binding protein [Niastella koreensis]AEV99648.1 hypothetical protein Niako_3334 [Niastella koreensis GR20-10]OQP49896.1 hypothetical protein A4D02_27865 [Niastella koreensis]